MKGYDSETMKARGQQNHIFRVEFKIGEGDYQQSRILYPEKIT